MTRVADWHTQGPVSLLLPTGDVITVDYRRGVSMLSRGVATPAPVEKPKRRRRKSADAAGGEVSTPDTPAASVPTSTLSATSSDDGDMTPEKEQGSGVSSGHGLI